MKSKLYYAKRAEGFSTGFVIDGYECAVEEIEAQIRSEIEKKYEDQWNASGLFKRWKLSRKIEKEIMALVVDRSKQVSPDALF